MQLLHLDCGGLNHFKHQLMESFTITFMFDLIVLVKSRKLKVICCMI